jgi:hypothetical protein
MDLRAVQNDTHHKSLEELEQIFAKPNQTDMVSQKELLDAIQKSVASGVKLAQEGDEAELALSQLKEVSETVHENINAIAMDLDSINGLETELG